MLTRFSHVRPAILDAVEKYTLFTIFAFFAYRMILGYSETGSLVTLVYLVDQLIVLCLLSLRRRTNAISARLDDWIVGFAGTFLALLYGPPGGGPLLPGAVVLGVMILGLAIHVSAKLTLLRSFGVVAANRGVKASGPYRLVRHPMYIGYMLSQAGLFLSGPTVNNAVVLCLCWGLFLWRIKAEERVLGGDPSYAALPRFKLVPGIY